MRRIIVVLLCMSVFFAPPSMAQNDWNRALAQYMAQRLLMQLANPKDSDFRVGIINTAAEFGALVSPKEAFPVSEIFAGSNGRLSWTAKELLDDSADRIRFQVKRMTVDAQTCPEFERAVSQFYSELDNALQRPVALSEMPPEVQPKRVLLDGTSYVLQIWDGERTLAIYPDRDIDLALDGASRVLLMTLGECSNRLPNTVETHYGR